MWVNSLLQCQRQDWWVQPWMMHGSPTCPHCCHRKRRLNFMSSCDSGDRISSRFAFLTNAFRPPAFPQQ
ncbi:unnamed protein product [Musa hybrid cultivar]